MFQIQFSLEFQYIYQSFNCFIKFPLIEGFVYFLFIPFLKIGNRCYLSQINRTYFYFMIKLLNLKHTIDEIVFFLRKSFLQNTFRYANDSVLMPNREHRSP